MNVSKICCSVLQRVAARCSMWQRVAVKMRSYTAILDADRSINSICSFGKDFLLAVCLRYSSSTGACIALLGRLFLYQLFCLF